MLNEKRVADKKKLKEQKERISQLNQFLIESENTHCSEEQVLTCQIEDLKKQLAEMSHITSNEHSRLIQIDTLTLNHKNAELRAAESAAELSEAKTKIRELQTDLEECHAAVAQLKQKRESALNEIKKLTIQIDVIKQSQGNPNKMNEFTELLNKAVNQSGSGH